MSVKTKLCQTVPLAIVTASLLFVLTSSARATLTLSLTGPSSVTLGDIDTIYGTITSDTPVDLTNSLLDVTVDTPEDPSLTYGVLNYDYLVPSTAPLDGTYTGPIFDFYIDPNTPPGSFETTTVIDIFGDGSSFSNAEDITQDVEDGVQGPGPGVVPEPSPLVSMLVMSSLSALWIVRQSVRRKAAVKA